MKRILSLLLVFILFMSVLPSSAEDYEEFDDDAEYEFDDGDMEFDDDLGETTEEEFEKSKENMSALSGYHDLDFLEDGDYVYQPMEDNESCQAMRYKGFDEDAEVPEKLGGMTVKSLYQTFSDCTMVETVDLPETLESIENMAFWKCISLTRIEIPEGVTKIGRCSFGGCIGLSEIVLPESLEMVDELVFIGCVELKEITFGKNLKSIGTQAFHSCSQLEKVRVPKGTEIAEDAFENCPALGEIEYYDP
ncbi:MAG: leucine-rich repeat domain-containing protein [Clostridia bacterium]|nr:leucine-rich repeat domain-containing protein [Clostridia bacterium]MBR4576413.1 leucine-rich repeat domain-containing protein [Clostridia bacterium]